MIFSYTEPLYQALKKHLAQKPDLPRLAVVGIGNQFNADDAAGVLTVQEMQRLLPVLESVKIFEGATAPENLTGSIRKFQPDWVWLIDAAEMDAAPGTVRLVDWLTVQGVSAFTHGLPPTLFARFLMEEFGASIFLFGIQPQMIDAFVDPSPLILKTCKQLAKDLSLWIKEVY